MSAKKQEIKKSPSARNVSDSFHYAEALEAVGRERINMLMPLDELQTNLVIDVQTQEKLMAIVAIMSGIGKLPGDLPKDKFDRPIDYHKLPPQAVEWLIKAGIPAREFTPLATYRYRTLFAQKDNCLVEEKHIEKFFSHWIHCLLIETQIIISKQYYHGLGFYKPNTPIVDFLESIPPKYQALFSKTQLNQIAVDQLHGKLYVDYCVIMIRAQWDKLISLSCLVFELKQNWDSIFEGIKALEQEVKKLENVHPAFKYYFNIFLEIAKTQLGSGGWLRGYRDSLLHGVGQHSSGVVPHKKSILTTSELWDKVCEEHNALREGIMTLLIAFASKNAPNTDEL